jgi:hypothetical protein
LQEKILVCHDIIRNFGISGVDRTMNMFNNR